MSNEQKQIEQWQKDDAVRLDTLFKQKAQVSQAEFGVRYGIGSQGMVSQYLKGRRALNIKAAEAFARGLGVSIDEFSPTIAEMIAGASETITRVPDRQGLWPFEAIDEMKIQKLSRTGRAQLEAAILIAAAQVGLDIKKDG